MACVVQLRALRALLSRQLVQLSRQSVQLCFPCRFIAAVPRRMRARRTLPARFLRSGRSAFGLLRQSLCEAAPLGQGWVRFLVFGLGSSGVTGVVVSVGLGARFTQPSVRAHE